MIDALIGGRLYGQAEERTGHAGSTFVTCKVRTTTNDGDTIFCNVIAFDDDVQRALLAMGDGDSVALSGALTPKVWIDKQGKTHAAVDLIAHAVLTAYHATRKRNAVRGQANQGGPAHSDDVDDEMA